MTVRDGRDTWLAGLARAGNGRALDELLERHWSLVHHIIGCGLVEHSDVDKALTALAGRLRQTAPGDELVRAWFATEARRQVRLSRRPTGTKADAPDFAATAVGALGLTGQARHVVEALRWLAPHDRDTLALWWLAETGELTSAEVAAASGDSLSDSDARVRRMAPRLDAARRVVAALAAAAVCGARAGGGGGAPPRPEPHRRDRLAAHVTECTRCTTELEPIEPLLGSLGLVPAPAIPRASMPSRPSTAPSGLDSSTRRRNAPAFGRSRDAGATPSALPDLPSSPGAGGSPEIAVQRGAAGARRYAGRRNSTASWGDLATGGDDPTLATPAPHSGSPVTALPDSAPALPPGSIPAPRSGSPLGSAAAWRGSSGRRGSVAGWRSGWAAGRRSAAAGLPGSAMGSAGVRQPIGSRDWGAGPRAVATWGGSATAGLRSRLAGPIAWTCEAGLRGAAAVRGLVSHVAEATSGLRYRGRRFRPTDLRRRAILVALAAVMLVVVAVVANRATRSAAPVHDPGPAATTTGSEPSPAAVTTIQGTPPAIGLAPPARAAAPERTPGPGLTSAAAVPPTPRPPATTSYEAEAARLSGAAETITTPGSSGGRVVHKLGTGTSNPYGYTERGAIEFIVNASTARRYTIAVYYVSGEQRTAYVRVNSGQSQAWTFGAGGWNQVTSATFQLDLRAGTNSIYLHNPAYWMPRLDRLTVTG